MLALCGESTSTINQAVMIQIQRRTVTDRQTDRHCSTVNIALTQSIARAITNNQFQCRQ